MDKDLKVTIRLRYGLDDDLIAWLGNLRVIYGQKGEIIKGALRRGLQTPAPPDNAHVETGNLLAEIRQVVEASIQSSLASLAYDTRNVSTESNDTLAEERLSRLEKDLMIETDDDESMVIPSIVQDLPTT